MANLLSLLVANQGRRPASDTPMTDEEANEQLKRELMDQIVVADKEAKQNKPISVNKQSSVRTASELRPLNEFGNVYFKRVPLLEEYFKPLKEIEEQRQAYSDRSNSLREALMPDGKLAEGAVQTDLTSLMGLLGNLSGKEIAYKAPANLAEQVNAKLESYDKEKTDLSKVKADILNKIIAEETPIKTVVESENLRNVYAPGSAGPSTSGAGLTPDQQIRIREGADRKIADYEKKLDREGVTGMLNIFNKFDEKYKGILDPNKDKTTFNMPGLGRSGKLQQINPFENESSLADRQMFDSLLANQARTLAGLSQTKSEIERVKATIGGNLKATDEQIVDGLRSIAKALQADIRRLEVSSPKVATYYKNQFPEISSDNPIFGGQQKKANPFK